MPRAAPRRKDLTGQVFGFLTVLGFDHTGTGKNPRAYWRCVCQCGAEVVRNTHQLVTYTKSGHKPSCGCMTKQQLSENHRTPNEAVDAMRRAWSSMKSRCYQRSYHNYSRYGGRGITVCDRWKDSYQNFYDDMAASWKPGLSLDRIDNDGNYEPENCRWATKKEQNNNQTRTVCISGEPLMFFAERHGLNPETVRSRIRDGVPDEELGWPVSTKRRFHRKERRNDNAANKEA